MCVLFFEYDKILCSWRRFKKIRMISGSGASSAIQRRRKGYGFAIGRALLRGALPLLALSSLALPFPANAQQTPAQQVQITNTPTGVTVTGASPGDSIVIGPLYATVNGVFLNAGPNMTGGNTLRLGPNGNTLNNFPINVSSSLMGGLAGTRISIGLSGVNLSFGGTTITGNNNALYGGGITGALGGLGVSLSGMLSGAPISLLPNGSALINGYQVALGAIGSPTTQLMNYPITGASGILPSLPGLPGMPSIPGIIPGMPSITMPSGMSIGTSLLTQLSGEQINAAAFTSALTQTGNISNALAQQLTRSILGNTSSSIPALGSVVTGLMGGQLSPQTALAISGIPNLGNISSIAGLSSVVSNPAVMSALRAVAGTSGAAGLAQQLGIVLASGSTTQLATSLLQNPLLAQQLSTMLGGVLGPQLTALLGGASGLLSAMMGGLAGALANSAETAALQSLAMQILQQSINLVNNLQCPGCNCCSCHIPIMQDQKNIRAHMSNQFELFRVWLVSTWYADNVVPGLMMMTSQMTTAAVNQIFMIGALLDAKHQMETQRLFNVMAARAHKDYHPSEGLCEFGTATRSLAASERRADLSQTAFAQHMLKRSLKSGETASQEGEQSDKRSRLNQFLQTYCDKNDNTKSAGNKGGLEQLCKTSGDTKRLNKDVDFTVTLDTPLTLDVDFIKPTRTDDEKDLFALSSNLYAHDVPPFIVRNLLANGDGDIRPDAFPYFMDLRSITAKRSVAQNSMAALTGMKSKGAQDVAPFLKAFMRDLNLEPTEIEKLIGTEPSYFAQMEVLTKKIYEDPRFYAELYDKPANTERKLAVMEALEIMQDRDIFDSLLRSEAILAVYLDTILNVEQDRVSNDILNVIGGPSDDARSDLGEGGAR